MKLHSYVMVCIFNALAQLEPEACCSVTENRRSEQESMLDLRRAD